MIEAICQSCGAKIEYGPDTEPLPHVTPEYVTGGKTDLRRKPVLWRRRPVRNVSSCAESGRNAEGPIAANATLAACLAAPERMVK